MSNGRTFICADIHGSAMVVESIIKQIKNPTKDDIIIVAGDAGLEYGNRIMGSAKRAMKKFIGSWIIMRGNHDNCYWADHDDWNIKNIDNNDYLYQKKYSNIFYVHDSGGIYTINGKTFLFIPGAYSVDKGYRLLIGYPYNPNEQLTDEDFSTLYKVVKGWIMNDFPIDYVVGHTFPFKMESTYNDLFLSYIEQEGVDKHTERNIDMLSEIFEKADGFKQYFGGHMHDNRKLSNKYTMVFQDPVLIDDNNYI